MWRPQRFMVLFALALPGCGPSEKQLAQAVVREFEQALRYGDHLAARRIVTLESRAAVDAMQLQAQANKAPLFVLEATAHACGLHVCVRDPNDDDKEGGFIVVRENGELRVDLVATAGLTAREVALPGPATRTVVRPLSDAERAHAAALAQQLAPAPADPSATPAEAAFTAR